jgi:hypothetical protein
MSKDREPFGICCMRADCHDHDCPGRAIAQLYQHDGGHDVIGEISVRTHAALPAPDDRLAWLVFGARVAIVAVGVGYWAWVVFHPLFR